MWPSRFAEFKILPYAKATILILVLNVAIFLVFNIVLSNWNQQVYLSDLNERDVNCFIDSLGAGCFRFSENEQLYLCEKPIEYYNNSDIINGCNEYNWLCGAIAKECFGYYGRLTSRFGFTSLLEWTQLRNIFTSIFLHTNFGHLAGNMLFLIIFGGLVELAMGFKRYLLLYLISGIGATIGFFITNVNNQSTAIGASGAIAGLIGAYLVIYSTKRHLGFNFIPAWRLILWITLEITYLLTVGNQGIAFSAHVFGFFTGAILGLVLKNDNLLKEKFGIGETAKVSYKNYY